MLSNEHLQKDICSFECDNLDKITKMELLTEEFIQENILSKAKQYDYLPIAFNNDQI